MRAGHNTENKNSKHFDPGVNNTKQFEYYVFSPVMVFDFGFGYKNKSNLYRIYFGNMYLVFLFCESFDLLFCSGGEVEVMERSTGILKRIFGDERTRWI